MGNAACTAFCFPSCAAFYQTKQNGTDIVNVALFFQKIWLKTSILAAILILLSKPEVVITNKGTCVLGYINLDKTKP